MFKITLLIGVGLFSLIHSKELAPGKHTAYQSYEACTGTRCVPKGTSCHKAWGIEPWGYSKNQLVKATSHRCKMEDGSYGESPLCCDKGSEEAEWIKETGAKPNEFPFVVYITSLFDYRNAPSKLYTAFSCTGSIYNKDYIITASHCVVNRDTGLYATKVTVTLGANHILTDHDEDRTYTATGVNNIIPHEKYNISNLKNDIAILRLDRSIKNFDKYIRPIRIANSKDNFEMSKVGIPIGYGKGPMGYSTDAMWGRPLQLTKAQAWSPELEGTVANCAAMVDEISIDKQICVGGYGKSGVGQGHSGGPLVCFDRSGSPYQCGISSFSHETCSIAHNTCPMRFDFPSIYTNIAYYVKNGWVSTKMNGATQNSSDNLKQLKYPYVEGQPWENRQ